MACCGGGRRKNGKSPGVKNVKSVGRYKGVKSLTAIQRTCPQCKWPMRKVHKYNPDTRKMDPKYYCSNSRCKYVQ